MNDIENAINGRDLQSIFRHRSFDPLRSYLFMGPLGAKWTLMLVAVEKGTKSWRLRFAFDVVVLHLNSFLNFALIFILLILLNILCYFKKDILVQLSKINWRNINAMATNSNVNLGRCDVIKSDYRKTMSWGLVLRVHCSGHHLKPIFLKILLISKLRVNRKDGYYTFMVVQTNLQSPSKVNKLSIVLWSLVNSFYYNKGKASAKSGRQ